MLVQFSVDNYRSIKDKVTLSMMTATKDKERFFNIRNYELLNSAVIYGSNASGKSNVLSAMAFMRRVVLNKMKVIQSTDTLPHDPFKLNTATQDASSTFEIIFFIGMTKYRYGFEIDTTTVYAEWLYADEKGKEAKLFYREVDEEEYVNPTFKEGYQFFDKKKFKINISKNQLFLWKCDQNDGVISKSILNWFKYVNIINGINHNGYINYTMQQMEHEDFRTEIIKFVKTADIGLEDIQLEETDVPKDMLEKLIALEKLKQNNVEEINFKQVNINTYHTKFDEKNSAVKTEVFELDREESLGTRKFFKMSAPILNTLQEGKILAIDELDASLHPMLTMHLIKLFHDPKVNTKNAQLIFTTHDTNLLKPHLFRRDQIWFTEKDVYGSTHLNALAEFKDVRKDADFEKEYIQGKYGAIPYLGKFEF
ncbi:AAA family ATPase [Sulfurospirillum cavolei]|uniref:AAA family ATPase n=1 Tax=Sulfurospirillum cavolei TaxID=366522 RepID=UPI0005A625F5|nr:ATP-binding protein [Sulfurospirillum cavolei]